MMTSKLGWLSAACVAVALAGCATTHGGLRHSADRLDHNAQNFAENAHEGPRGYDENASYAEDARDFADQAHQFRRAVDEHGRDDSDVRDSFHELSRSYNALRDDVQRSGDREARHELHPVTQAYLDVEDEMGGARAPSRYSERDEDDGPG